MIKSRAAAAIVIPLFLVLFVMILLPAHPVSGDEGARSAVLDCSDDHPPTCYKQPWMIYTNDPTTMDILIETDQGVDNDSDHIKIHFQQSGVSCSRSYTKMVIDLMEDRRLWTFHCSGFQPNRFYNYTIYYRDWYSSIIDYCWHSHSGWFLTPPADNYVPSNLAFYAYGDTRKYTQDPAVSDRDALGMVAREIYKHHNSHYNEGAFIIHTGDIVPNGGKVAHWEVKDGTTAIAHRVDPWTDQFFGVPSTASMLAQLPIFTTIGNHDFESDDDNPHFYYRYFKYPMYHDRPTGSSDLGSFYYSFHWGPAAFYSLSTYPMDGYCGHSPSLEKYSDQYVWLEDAFEGAAKPVRPWKIVFMHACPYDANQGCNHPQIRDNFVPLFEEYGVDLVLSGHEHYYSRKEVNGIQYLVLGGGGSGLSGMRYPEDVDVAILTHHFAYFEINGDKMTVTVIDYLGETIDVFTMDKAPRADFEVVGESAGLPPLEVQFENLSIGHISEYLWDFGDETTSTDISPTHVYDKWGYYTVTLTADSGLATHTIVRPNFVRVGYDADFSANPTQGAPPLTVEFAPSQPNAEYSHWAFGDGNELRRKGTVSHTYDGKAYGNLTVAHTVGDHSGNRITMTKPYYIKVEPYVDFAYDAPNRWQPYRFHFTETSQGGGGIFSRGWIFGDLESSGEQNPIHDYPEWAAGSVEVEFYATFNDVIDGQVFRDSTRKLITVPQPIPPDADFYANQTQGAVPLTVVFEPSAPDAYYSSWYFGEGEWIEASGAVSYTYESNGMFDVCHLVRHDRGPSNSTWKYAYIKLGPWANPILSAEYYEDADPPHWIVEFDTEYYELGQSCTWKLGDGRAIDECLFNLAFYEAGTLEATLTVSARGFTDSGTATVQLELP